MHKLMKVQKKLDNVGYNTKLIEAKFGYILYVYPPDGCEYSDYDNLRQNIRCFKDVELEHFSHNVMTVQMCEEKEKRNKFYKNRNTLSDVFYMALRKGISNDEAVEVQRKYAMENNMMDEFRSIYA